MARKDDNPPPGNEASVPQLPSGVFFLPVIELNTHTLHYDRNNDLIGELSTRCGKVLIEIRDNFVHCRGDQETLIGNGILKPEWLPGIPGNGRFSHSVILNENRKQGGSEIAGLPPKQHRIRISAWSHFPPTLEVRLPLTEGIRQQIEHWKAQEIHSQSSAKAKESKPRHSKQGNVVYLHRSD